MITTFWQADAQRAAHSGLYFHRRAVQPDGALADNGEHIRRSIERPTPSCYPAAYERWTRAVRRVTPGVSLTVKVVHPLLLGLGNPSPTENGVTLHHTYGVPYLPGSALKGLTRQVALDRGLLPHLPSPTALDVAAARGAEPPIAQPGHPELAQQLFGGILPEDPSDAPGAAGHVVFWDAWLKPGGRFWRMPLVADTITVHHPGYYAGKPGHDGAPTDFDDPIPLPLITTRTDVTFTVVLSCPASAKLAQHAADLLEEGLTEYGLGAKTNVGYGRFSVTDRTTL